MSHAFQKILGQQDLHSMQSWYEPALHLLNEMLETAKANLRRRNYSEANAAVLREHFREQLQRRCRISMHTVFEIEKSMARAGQIEYIGGSFVKPMNKDSQNNEVKP